MNLAIILSGGKGIRLGTEIPKQYIEVNNKPIIAYSLDPFEETPEIDQIIIVCSNSWRSYLKKWVGTKFMTFADAGTSRQESIKNGLVKGMQMGAKVEDKVIIHDAARPNVSKEMIQECIRSLENADGVMPVLPVKDTLYYSESGTEIGSLLNRDAIYAGQAPEAFIFGKYYSINVDLNEDELKSVRGSSEIAFKSNLKIALIHGDEHNYKITTEMDLEKFRRELNESL